MKLVYRHLSPAGSQARMPVLIFHRVLAEFDPLFPAEIDARRFQRICTWLRRWFRVLPLDEAIRLHRCQALPERALAITFDDGYADNHDVAMPILKSHGMSATFFIASGFLDGGCMWNDKVIEAVRQTRHSMLDLSDCSDGLLGHYAVETTEQKQVAVGHILSKIKYLQTQPRLALADRVLQVAGVRAPEALMMSSSQVRAMHDSGMQIGAHTLSHPILAGLDKDAASHEILGSRDQLQRIVDAPVSLFAYPNGKLKTDYSPETAALVRELGFDAAVTTNPGVLTTATDLFQIPRYTPWETDKARFSFRLAQMIARKR